jgi:hypothetical protein
MPEQHANDIVLPISSRFVQRGPAFIILCTAGWCSQHHARETGVEAMGVDVCEGLNPGPCLGICRNVVDEEARADEEDDFKEILAAKVS